MLTVKEEKSHGEGRENKTDKRNHDGRKEGGSEVLSDVAGVRRDFSSLSKGGVNSDGKKESSCGSDGRKHLLGDGVHFRSVIGGLGHQLCSGNRRSRNRLEAIDSLQADEKGGQSGKEFHLDI